MTYKIKLVSQAHIIALLIILFGVCITLVSLIPRSITKQWGLLGTVSYMTLSIILWRKSVVGKTVWTITEKGVGMEWSKRFRFDHNSKGFFLDWDQIKDFRIKNDGYYRKIKIELNSGETIIFFHDNSAIDDFTEFGTSVEKTFKQKSYS